MTNDSQAPGEAMDPKQRPLYLSSADTGGEPPIPITFERLASAQDEVINVMEGCLSIVEDLEGINSHYEFEGPLLMLRVTLQHGVSQLLSVAPDKVMPEASP